MNRNLFEAMKSHFSENLEINLIETITEILESALITHGITLKQISKITEKDVEDLLFILFDFKILIPNNAYRGLEWQDTEFVLGPNQAFNIPTIIKSLVQLAIDSGIWNPEEAIRITFEKFGEKEYKKMPYLVKALYNQAKNYRISGGQITEICNELSLEARAGIIISELKGIGIMSPQLSRSLFTSLKKKSPLYELNPSLF
ncbi:MAG: hypothetical protein BAJALOKI3v1_220006 [Promethearchaeota archaeon]|nr:MAG: hypothetical protein BAJALOKI3v1_220006 [Candidatus Lokiarchaeota archaeon]